MSKTLTHLSVINIYRLICTGEVPVDHCFGWQAFLLWMGFRFSVINISSTFNQLTYLKNTKNTHTQNTSNSTLLLLLWEGETYFLLFDGNTTFNKLKHKTQWKQSDICKVKTRICLQPFVGGVRGALICSPSIVSQLILQLARRTDVGRWPLCHSENKNPINMVII